MLYFRGYAVCDRFEKASEVYLEFTVGDLSAEYSELLGVLYYDVSSVSVTPTSLCRF